MSNLALDKYRKRSQQSLISEQERAHSDEIYIVLFKLLVENGYGKITLQEISKKTGISRTTFYRRWASIDDLIIEAIAEKVHQSIEIPKDIEPYDALKIMLEQLALFLQSELGHAFLQASLNISDEVSLSKREDLWEKRYQLIKHTFHCLLPEEKNNQEVDDIISMTLGSIYFNIFIKNKKVDDFFINSIIKNSLTLIQRK